MPYPFKGEYEQAMLDIGERIRDAEQKLQELRTQQAELEALPSATEVDARAKELLAGTELICAYCKLWAGRDVHLSETSHEEGDAPSTDYYYCPDCGRAHALEV